MQHTYTAHSSFSFLIELYRACKERKQDGIILFTLFHILRSANDQSQKAWVSQQATPRALVGHPIGTAEMKKTQVRLRSTGQVELCERERLFMK